MGLSAIVAAALAGALGGLHCAAMCGAWITAFSFRPAAVPLRPARAIALENAVTHAGRITTYTLIGAALGAAGGEAFAIEWAPLQRAIYVVANIMLLLLAVALARGAAQRGSILEAAGLRAFRRLLPAAKALAAKHRAPARFALGLVWGATPCALVYGVLPLALFAGSARDGALIMLAFGIGTLPNLVGAAYLLARSRSLLLSATGRFGAALIVGGFATYGIYRALFIPEALGSGPFCLPGFAA